MPSRHRLRHSSSNNAPQILLNNSKCATTNAAKTTTITNQKSFSTSSFNNNLGTTGYNQANNHKLNDGGVLTEKQQRIAYLTTLTKEQLKIECRKRGQKTSGNRTELLQRLGVKMSQIQKQELLHHHHHHEGCSQLTGRKVKDNINSIGNDCNSSQKLQNNKSNLSLNGSTTMAGRKQQNSKDKEKEKEEREKIVLWRKPFLTIKYCFLECVTLSNIYGRRLIQHRITLFGFLLLLTILGGLYKIPGRHQLFIDMVRSQTWFIVYWVGLGVLSSVGLGTGLHTFILYLGPHIASVTLAAYECNALNFPKPPYPDDIICPEIPDTNVPVNLWNIMAKVRFEAFLWGVGTALGELPPYFMAKAARLSGYDPDDDEDLQKFEELQKKQETGDLSTLDKAKLFMEKVVEKVGFLGILACASIPNPLFDLAGITCGHFLVPFWTFFGATVIGKAIIKMHIQKIFVIIAFNESLIERAVDLFGSVPIFGHRLQEPFKAFLENQKKRLHRSQNKKSKDGSIHTLDNSSSSSSGNLLSKIFEKFVIAMVCYFIISIINSLAQSYHKRIHKKGGSNSIQYNSNTNNSNNSGKFYKKLVNKD